MRLEPLFDELLPALKGDDRLPAEPHLRFSVDLGSAHDFEASPLQLRGVVKNAIVEALAARGVDGGGRRRAPDIVFVARRAGTPDAAARWSPSISARRAPSPRRPRRRRSGPASRNDGRAADHAVAVGCAHPSRWSTRWPAARRFRSKPPAWRSARRSGARTTCRSDTWRAFAGLPTEAPDLFPGTVPRILALDIDEERIPAMVGNLRAAGLTGKSHENTIVIGQKDVRGLTPD